MIPFAGLKLRRSYSTWVLLATMAVVALLAWQQYRWIQKVAAVEEKTSREKFEASLNAFADEFDTEITRAHLLFVGLDGQTRSDVLEKARERLRVFKKLSIYPDLIASVDTDVAPPSPYMIDPGPPPALTVPTIFARPVRLKPGMPALIAGTAVAGTAGVRLEAGKGVVRTQFRLGTPVLLRIVLNQKYVIDVLLPALLRRHLGANAEQHYDVLIQSASEKTAILRWGSENSRSWDSAIRIFAIRPDCLLGPGNQTYTITTGPATVTNTTGTVRGLTTPNLASPDLASLLGKPGSCSNGSNAAAGLWLVNIRARPSLREAVDSARRQSLGISLGVMLALAMAIIGLFVSGHRARELAARHEQFAAGVSHELRTPLSVISSASANLADGVVENGEQARQYGKMIHTHSKQLSEMIENALWFAQRHAKDELEVQDVDVEELLSSAAATCGHVLQQAGVVLERDIEPGLPCICANRVLLLHALQNLLTNVARHGRSGRWARVRATLEGSDVVFTVEDRGDGIPPDEAARVFEPFYRGKGAKANGLAGLGLGLTLVKKIIEAHGGRIELRSKRNLGTTIAFTVPACVPEEVSAPLEAPQLRHG